MFELFLVKLPKITRQFQIVWSRGFEIFSKSFKNFQNIGPSPSFCLLNSLNFNSSLVSFHSWYIILLSFIFLFFSCPISISYLLFRLLYSNLYNLQTRTALLEKHWGKHERSKATWFILPEVLFYTYIPTWILTWNWRVGNLVETRKRHSYICRFCSFTNSSIDCWNNATF